MSHTQTTTETTQGVESVFQKVRLEVIESYPSVYTKDDVILLIDRIQRDVQDSNTGIGLDALDLLEKIKQRIKTVFLRHDFDSDITLDLLRDKSIEVTFDDDYIIGELEENIEEIFDTEFKESK